MLQPSPFMTAKRDSFPIIHPRPNLYERVDGPLLTVLDTRLAVPVCNVGGDAVPGCAAVECAAPLPSRCACTRGHQVAARASVSPSYERPLPGNPTSVGSVAAGAVWFPGETSRMLSLALLLDWVH